MIPIKFDNLVDGKIYLCYRTCNIRGENVCHFYAIFKMEFDNNYSLEPYNGMRRQMLSYEQIYSVCRAIRRGNDIKIMNIIKYPTIILSEDAMEYFELSNEEILNHIVAERL